MTLDAVLIGDPGGQSRMEKFFFREILAGSLELHNVAVGTPTSPLSDFTLPRGPGLPEVASSTHLAVVVKGQAFLWRSKQEFLDIEYGLPRFVGPAGLEGMKNSAVGGHNALFHPNRQMGMAPLIAAAESRNLQITGVRYETQVRPVLFPGKGVS